MGSNHAEKPRRRKRPAELALQRGKTAAYESEENSSLRAPGNLLKAMWIVEPAGPCIYRVVTEKRFLKYDENLFGGFFAALQTFAQCIESDEALRLDLKDVTFSFVKSPRAIVAGVSDKGVDVTPLLARVSQAFSEVISKTLSCPFNPLIPSDMRELEQALSERIRKIIPEAKTSPRGATTIGAGGKPPKLEKPVTETLDRGERLVERSRIIPVELADYVKLKKKVGVIDDETSMA